MKNKKLYIFDLDETLLNGDSAMLWHQFLVKMDIIQQADFLQEDQRLMALYSQGKLDMQQYLNFCIAPISNITIKKIDELVKQFIATDITPRIFPQAKQLIKVLQSQKKEIIIISATVDFLVSKIAQSLAIKHHLAINLEIEDSCYRSSIKGVPSYQQGKVIRLKEWLEAQDTTYQSLCFYTDSINDLSLCEYADETHVVNPCSQLAHKADQNRWKKHNWQ